MIDTSKYKGHYTDDFARFWVTADDELNADIERANATTNLIDDAPRLLAEVKRLREENKVLAKYRDIVNKYDDALLADGDEDPRWSELYD
jgi:hypothetical protein